MNRIAYIEPIGGIAGDMVLAALVVVGFITLAVLGSPETKRALSPYGLLKPGSLWLAIFYLAPLWTLLKISLSSKETRFAVFPTFSWEFSNYGKAFSDFGPQFTRAFLYAGIATTLTILIGYPIAYGVSFLVPAGELLGGNQGFELVRFFFLLCFHK